MVAEHKKEGEEKNETMFEEKCKDPNNKTNKAEQINQVQQQEARRSNRFIGQNMKIAEKAEDLTRKRNLEGTNLSSHNSFSVLSNDILVDKANNMGIKDQCP